MLGCGGRDDGGIGSCFNRIEDGMNDLEEDGLWFFDVGCGEMNLDMGIEMYEGEHEVLKVNAGVVEGSFTGCVKLSSG
ncbi:PTS sugar transporter subunit IIA domain-containing protein, partial [Staphylococcus capitis]